MNFGTRQIKILIGTALILLMLFSVYFVSFADADTGVPNIISYQGHLTDSGGNLLGGVGTPYYFRFSFWDSPTVGSGNKVWPATSPSSVPLTVKQGSFSVNIGDTTNGYPDTLNYNWNTNSKVYLQIEISSDNTNFETLTPRSLITSAPTSQVASQVNGVNPSSFGTTTPFLNTLISALSNNINSAVMTIKGMVGQVANLFNINDSSGNSLFVVTADGKVGVGTASPNALLNVNGAVIFGGAVADPFGAMLNVQGNNGTGNFDVFSAGNPWGLGGDAGQNIFSSRGTVATPTASQLGDRIAGIYMGGYGTSFNTTASIESYANQTFTGSAKGTYLQFRTTPDNSTSRATAMTILGNGNVGIGTSTPNSRLNVWGNLSVGTSSTPTLFANTSTSKVGINIAAPTQALEVSGNVLLQYGNQLCFGSCSYSTISTSDPGSEGLTIAGGSTASLGQGLTLKANGTNDLISVLKFVVGGSERMRINRQGNVGIGTTTPSARLDLYGASGSSTDLFAISSSTNSRMLTFNSTGQLNWGTGLGAINHLIGPTDQTLGILAGGANSVNISGGSVGTSVKGGDIVISGGNSSTNNSFYQGGSVLIQGGASTGNKSGSITIQTLAPLAGAYTSGGDITLATGDTNTGGATGNILIKSGSASSWNNNMGAVTITTGGGVASTWSNPGGVLNLNTGEGGAVTGASSFGASGGVINIQPGAGGASSGTTAAGGGNGGTLNLIGAAGGNANGSGGSQTGGNGSTLSFISGTGGSATGASGTRIGGNSGNIVFNIGAAGMGSTTNGTLGNFQFLTGNVGIGTTTPSAQLTTTGTLRFSALTGAGANLIVDSLGNVTVSSDERLKNIDNQFTRGLSDLQKINPITFHWKPETGYDTKDAQTGFSAQNIQLAIPEAVATSSNGFLTLSDRPILATVVNAIKEISAKLEKILAWFGGDGSKFNVSGDVCVDNVCVTKDQFKAMLQNAGGTTQLQTNLLQTNLSVQDVTKQQSSASNNETPSISSSTSTNSSSTNNESSASSSSPSPSSSTTPDPTPTSTPPSPTPASTPDPSATETPSIVPAVLESPTQPLVQN